MKKRQTWSVCLGSVPNTADKERASSWLKLSEVKVHGYLSTCVLAGRQPGNREEEQNSSTPFKDALQ